jgi:CRISPR type III-B/RAMP module RAMP protein Cmr6
VNSNRLLLHLGRASVLENVGIYCERTTGLPLIPGTAVKGVLSTFFEGSLANAVAALVASKDSQLTAEELQKLESIIQQARQP